MSQAKVNPSAETPDRKGSGARRPKDKSDEALPADVRSRTSGVCAGHGHHGVHRVQRHFVPMTLCLELTALRSPGSTILRTHSSLSMSSSFRTGFNVRDSADVARHGVQSDCDAVSSWWFPIDVLSIGIHSVC